MSNRKKIQEAKAMGRRISDAWGRRNAFVAEVRRAFREGPARFGESDRTNKGAIIAVLAMVAIIIVMIVI